MSNIRTKPRVLVVDDNLQTLKLLRFLLEDEGYEVMVASNARLARQILENPPGPVNLMILDVMMPGLDGFDLVQQIRQELKVRTGSGREADLTPTETKLLHCLMRNAGRVLARDVLINQVWDYDYEGNNNTVDVYIRRLRQLPPTILGHAGPRPRGVKRAIQATGPRPLSWPDSCPVKATPWVGACHPCGSSPPKAAAMHERFRPHNLAW